MATATGYPDGVTSSDWNSQPSTAEEDHYTLVDETYPPGDNTDYLWVAGFSTGKIARLTLPTIADDIDRITQIDFVIYLEGYQDTNVPALQVFLYVKGIEKANAVYEVDTGNGTWVAINVSFTGMNILGPDWYAGPREVAIKPRNGNITWPEYEVSA